MFEPALAVYLEIWGALAAIFMDFALICLTWADMFKPTLAVYLENMWCSQLSILGQYTHIKALTVTKGYNVSRVGKQYQQ